MKSELRCLYPGFSHRQPRANVSKEARPFLSLHSFYFNFMSLVEGPRSCVQLSGNCIQVFAHSRLWQYESQIARAPESVDPPSHPYNTYICDGSTDVIHPDSFFCGLNVLFQPLPTVVNWNAAFCVNSCYRWLEGEMFAQPKEPY